MEEIKVYSVVWRYAGSDFVIDVDDEEHAHRLARHIAESRERTNVRVIVSDIEIPDSILEKIKTRIASRIKELSDPLEVRLHGNH